MASDGIVLFAKPSGQTSFNSLFTIKKALSTKKVGHTGTLDSFADGLLVVCVGSCTHLVSYITEFDKEYDAIIKFGEETDTLDPTGEVVRTADLPSLADLTRSIKKWTGNVEQFPPAYSAIHVDGKRLSDLAREGKTAEIPSRKITVFASDLLEVRTQDGKSFSANNDLFEHDLENQKILYAHVHFSVSKGTYIRSLARDIANDCNSCAHLVALRRTRVGNFKLEDAAGAKLLPPFSIDTLGNFVPQESVSSIKVIECIKDVDENFSELCGFHNLKLKNEFIQDFKNGKPLRKTMFAGENSFDENELYAVFCENAFSGLVTFSDGKLSYCFVRAQK